MRAGLALLACFLVAACAELGVGVPDHPKPPPGGFSSVPPPPDMATTEHASYTCDDGSAFDVTFDDTADTATVVEKGAAVTLAAASAGSGFRYIDPAHELAGKADDATWTVAGKARHCTAKS